MRYVDIDGVQPNPPRWVIPGFIGHGVTGVIAGRMALGRDDSATPASTDAAGLHGSDLMPRPVRHVVYITEGCGTGPAHIGGHRGTMVAWGWLEAVHDARAYR